MSQHDYNIANGGGAAVRADLNNALQAILSQNSGATAPTTTKPFMTWYDTTAGVLKIRNPADTAWLTLTDTSGNIALLSNAIVTQAKLAANVAGNGPAFHAYQTTSQNVSNGTVTKVALQTEAFDTNNNFDNTTNYRFTPTVAGYYQFFGQVTMGTPNGTNNYLNAAIHKNGVAFNQSASTQPSNGNYASAYCSALVYCNGTTDYIEFYTDHNNFVTNPAATIPTNWTYLTGFLARAA